MTTPDAYRRDELSRLLRELRRKSGMNGRDTAMLVGFSQSKLSKIENGMLLPAFADVDALLGTLGADAEQRDQVLDVLRLLREETDSARVILQRGAFRQQQKIARLEADTTVQRGFDLGAVIGLLQTPDYMRRIFGRRMTAADREKAVTARLERRHVLDDAGRTFRFVMTEGALRWRAGPASMMAAQLDHVADVSRWPNVRVGVIPWTTEAHVFPGHDFHIYDERAVITATETATALIEDPRDIAVYLDLFAELERLADVGDAGCRHLVRIADEYRAS